MLDAVSETIVCIFEDLVVAAVDVVAITTFAVVSALTVSVPARLKEAKVAVAKLIYLVLLPDIKNSPYIPL